MSATGLAEEGDLRQPQRMWQHLGGTAWGGAPGRIELMSRLTAKSKISAPDRARA